MKKLLILLIGIVGLMAVSCEPMEDIYDDIDTSLKVEGTADYTLSEDDYSTLEVANNKFSSIDDAKALIPGLLKQKYPAFTENSLANVYFNVDNATVVEEYTVTAADYGEIGLSNEYATGISDVESLLENSFPQAEDGDFVKLTYRTLADEIMYTLDPDDYDVIGDILGDTYPDPASNAAQFNTFEIRSDRDSYWNEDMITEALGVVIDDNYGSVAGQLYNVGYATYNGSKETTSMKIKFDGNSYVMVDTGDAYELISEDYQMIASELADTYPDAAASMAEFENFEKRDTGVYWEDNMIEEALNILLMEEFPGAAEGDKFAVTYDVYNGNAITETTFMIKSGDEFIINEDAGVSTIQTTQVYSYANGNWTQPFVLGTEDYTAMGQSYPNFDDEDELAYKLAIFLNNKYPYAEPGDYVAVAYDFYTSGSGTATKYSNFVFEDGSFQYISDVMESSLQFGYDGVNWVPDNTIQYSFTTADYSLVASELMGPYPAQAGNLESYGNFNRGGGSTSWDDEMMLDAINIVLDNIDPNAEVGQKYVISYIIYSGGYSTESVNVIKTEDGSWIYNN